MRRAAALVFLVACTGTTPTPGPSPSDPPPTSAAHLAVVGPGGPHLEGMRLAAEEEGLVLSHASDLGEALEGAAPAVAYAGDPALLVEERLRIEGSGKVVFLFDGDLYSPRTLFRAVFQVSTPMLWEARVLAKYLVGSGIRTARPVYGEQREAERAALTQAAREEGLRLRPGAPATISVARTASLQGHEGSPLATGVGGLGLDDPAPGTVAVAPYTWAGWAEPIPRVAAFREAFRERTGRLPGAPDQEGYDAVRLLADALDRAEGDDLLRALESFRDEAYAGLPVRLGPDDHILVDDSELGLFIVPGADDPRDQWETDPPHWRPLMRTFTYDGERTVILDRDKPIFFPRWKATQPSPKYRRSKHGITEGPG